MGEILEITGVESIDETSGLLRARVRAMSDGRIGPEAQGLRGEGSNERAGESFCCFILFLMVFHRLFSLGFCMQHATLLNETTRNLVPRI